MKKRLTALACAVCLLTGSALAAGEGYTDVPAGVWYASAVEEMTSRGIMTGVTAAAFAPGQQVDRATVITVLWRMLGSPDVAVDAPFPDAEGTWYAKAAAWGKWSGVATGYADGRFGGSDPVTREQLAAFLHRYDYAMGKPMAEGALGLFSDAEEISPWAEDAMRHAVGTGILQGGSDGLIRPRGAADRASLAVMLQRMLTPAAG